MDIRKRERFHNFVFLDLPKIEVEVKIIIFKVILIF